jgi:hypothetical protein
VPFQELSPGSVGSAFRQIDDLTGLRVDLVTIAEVHPKPRADEQAMLRIHTQIPAVEQGVDI